MSTVRVLACVTTLAGCVEDGPAVPEGDDTSSDGGADESGHTTEADDGSETTSQSGSTSDDASSSGEAEDPGPTGPGTITSFPLPALDGAPFSTLTQSKHTNMANDGVRLYVSGGDWTMSATDGTWSMDLQDGTWRQDVGAPVHPSLPAPHALQDGAGFVWIPERGRFLLWPGSYYAYEEAGSPILDYARGMWWFDPITNVYVQELGLFADPGSSSGSIFGGVYDEVNEEIVVFGDSGTGLLAHRWSVAQLQALPDLSFELEIPAAHAVYFNHSQHAKIDREVYILGVLTAGERETQTPLFLRWHLDDRRMEELAPPPADGPSMEIIEVRLGVSHGKVVWPFVRGPEGELHGIHVYDPVDDSWFVDAQVPDYGNFIGNSVASLPDDRVVWSGGVFGRQQTHIWFYEAG